MSFDLFESVSSIRARDFRHDETSFASTMMDCGASPKGLSTVILHEGLRRLTQVSHDIVRKDTNLCQTQSGKLPAPTRYEGLGGVSGRDGHPLCKGYCRRQPWFQT